MNNTGNGGNAVAPTNGSTAWNWTALSQQAVARNTAHAQQRQSEVAQHVKAAAAAVRGRVVTKVQKPRTTPVSAAVEPTTKTPPLTHPNAETESFSGLRIADRKISDAELTTEMTDRKFIPLRTMDEVSRDVLNDEHVDWVTIGVVARKTLSKAAVNGSSFMVWSLSDLGTTELAVFLFDNAYGQHWRALEGTIVAVLNAPLMPASEKNKFALKVTKAEDVVVLGRAVDFGICKGMTSSDVRCRLVVNTAKSQYCLHHIATSFVAAGKRRQQLNNSFSTFNKSMFSSKSQLKNISAGVYGARPSAGTAVVGRRAPSDGWHPIITSNKRKRSDTPSPYSNSVSSQSSGAILGVPTIISSSGSVLQQRPTSAGPATKKATVEAFLVGSSNDNTGNGVDPRASRGQRIIASMLSKSGNATTVLRPNKGKKVDMIKFMRSGNQS